MKVLISGDAGSGKTAVIQELVNRGYTAYSTEELPGVNIHIVKATGEIVDRPPAPVNYSVYSASWDRAKLIDLLESDELVFIADLNSHLKDFYELFDKFIVLTIDKETQRHRLLNRTSNPYGYGKHPEELKAILEYHDRMQVSLLQAPGVIGINATQPLTAVADECIRRLAL
ncbi:MAG: hypothetical protein JWM81_210 [Candidatus Saccharibacteria bacterium]|nr:hypothetical protein [Candidatus Saccharibacteria bacterium]